MYDVCLNFYGETGLLVAGSAIFVGDGCTRTDTIGTDAVYETNSGSGTGWGVTNVGCGVNSGGNLVRGEGGVSGVSTACGEGIP